MHTNRTLFFALSIALCAFLASTTTGQAQVVRLHGAVTLSKLLTEKKEALESQSGVKLEIVGNGAGRGLADLGAGQADIAVLAGSMKGVADAMNKDKAGSVNIAGMVETPVSVSKLVLVSHPAVGVKSLTEAQAHDIFTGKITNWKDVGGASVPIKVVMPFAGDGSRVSVQEQLLKGEEFIKNPIVRNSSKDIIPVIGQLEGAVSFLTEKNAEGLTRVACDKDLTMPQSLVTKGEPAGDLKKVVDAVKAITK